MEEVPEFVKKLATQPEQNALALLVGTLGAGYEFLRKKGMPKRDAADMLIEIMRAIVFVTVGRADE